MLALASDVSPLVQTLGRFHLVLLHLPIGLIPGLALLEFGAAVFRRPIPRGALLALSLLTALTAGAALATGLILAGEKVDSELLGKHKNFAIAMTVIAALLPILAALRSRRPFRIGIAAALLLSVPTGHFGGSLTHREGFLFAPLQRADGQARQAGDDVVTSPDADAASTGTGPADASPVTDGSTPQAPRYDTDVKPIFTRVCTSCHNPDDYDGDLDLTTRAGILCLDRAEPDRVLMPGDPAKSYLLEVCLLPKDDEYHMPPEDEEQLTAAEIETLRRWILAGCAFE